MSLHPHKLQMQVPKLLNHQIKATSINKIYDAQSLRKDFALQINIRFKLCYSSPLRRRRGLTSSSQPRNFLNSVMASSVSPPKDRTRNRKRYEPKRPHSHPSQRQVASLKAPCNGHARCLLNSAGAAMPPPSVTLS